MDVYVPKNSIVTKFYFFSCLPFRLHLRTYANLPEEAELWELRRRSLEWPQLGKNLQIFLILQSTEKITNVNLILF